MFYLILFGAVMISLVHGAVPETGDIKEQGLYSVLDNVEILTYKNFERKVYGQRYAYVVQFYNSYCGHCRAFAPKFKGLATEIASWKETLRLGVLDCSVEENNELCRRFEVLAYPSLRYLHERYSRANGLVGERLEPAPDVAALREQLVHRLQAEQTQGRLTHVPDLSLASYTTYAQALSQEPLDFLYAFLVFENVNSTIGSELILGTHDYQRVVVKRIDDKCELAESLRNQKFPALVAVRNTLEATPLTPKIPTTKNFLRAMNLYLESNHYVFPTRDVEHYDATTEQPDNMLDVNNDVVYYADLEKTLKTALHTEITRHKKLTGEVLQALIDFLDVVITSFPFKRNSKSFFLELRATLASKSEWSGSEVYHLILDLEKKRAPVFDTELEYISCKGSGPQYRGYTCGLWMLFHTLTVNAARLPGAEGPRVLRAMLGYVKHFFGCTECAQHFQEMATRNRLMEVQESERAVLWLWIAHNEVNLRLAGDSTEDPHHPKMQFPSAERCPSCRLVRGAWSLPAVLRYLQRVYAAEAVRAGNPRSAAVRASHAAAAAPQPLSALDVGVLSLLYLA